jgi:hypothetical protein
MVKSVFLMASGRLVSTTKLTIQLMAIYLRRRLIRLRRIDEKAQVIVATNVTQQANDKQQLEPLIEEIKSNTDENKPKKVSADSGYFSETNVEYLEEQQIDGFIATNRQKHSDSSDKSEKPEPAQCGRIPKDATKQKRMARKLRTKKGREIYSKRKYIVEPVFGFIRRRRTSQRGSWLAAESSLFVNRFLCFSRRESATIHFYSGLSRLPWYCDKNRCSYQQ